MEIWIPAIVEWINCLGICDEPVLHIRQLQDIERIYSKLIKELTKDDEWSSHDDGMDVSKFIRHEYPEIIIPTDSIDDESKQIYTLSLFLISAAQRVSFHRPMYKLKNETQILIKSFLEMILPYGQNITLHIIHDTILELNDTAPKTQMQTPKNRSLKKFLSSPAAHSAYHHRMMNERTRELRVLKAQLETEKFEKADLQEDLKILKEKIQHLQNELKRKSQELKVLHLKETMPITPKSARKSRNDGNESEHLRKGMEQLRVFNSKLQDHVDRLETEHERLIRRSTSQERISEALRLKVDEYEGDLETLVIQLEMRTNELLDLKMQNEELRVHINGMQKYSIDVEQSFEVEHVFRARSPPTELNVSEAASSIIDIQLRESCEETAKLRTELIILQQKLDTVLYECEVLKRHNESLEKKNVVLNEIQMALEIAEDKLSKKDCQLSIIGMEKQSLQDALKTLQGDVSAREFIVRIAESKICELELKISHLNEELNCTKISLVTAEDAISRLIASKEIPDMKVMDFGEKMDILEKLLTTKTTECDKILRTSQNKIYRLGRNILTCSNAERKPVGYLILNNRTIEKTTVALPKRILEMHLLKSNVQQWKDLPTSTDPALSEMEMKLCELNELQNEPQSQLFQEQQKIFILSTKHDELESSPSPVDVAKNESMNESSTLHFNINGLQQRYDAFYEKIRLHENSHRAERRRVESCHKKGNLTVETDDMILEDSELKNQENLENTLTQDHKSCFELMTEKIDLEQLFVGNVPVNYNRLGEIQMLQTSVNECHTELEQIHVRYNSYITSYMGPNYGIQNLLGTIAGPTLELNTLNRKISELEKITQRLKYDYNSTFKNVEVLSAKKIALRNSLTSHASNGGKLMTEITVFPTEFGIFCKDIRGLKGNYVNVPQQFENITQAITFLQNKLEVLRSECMKITSKYSSLKNEVDRKMNQLDGEKTRSEKAEPEIDTQRWTEEHVIHSYRDQRSDCDELNSWPDKRLPITQNSSEFSKLNANLHEQLYSLLKPKIAQLYNGQINSDLELEGVINDIIIELREVQLGRGVTFETQVEDLNNEILTLHIFEEQVTPRKLQQELNSIKADSKIIVDVCEMLGESIQLNIADMRRSLKHHTTKNLASKLEIICSKIVAYYGKVPQHDKSGKKNDVNKIAHFTLSTEEQGNRDWLNGVHSPDIELKKRNAFLSNSIQKKREFHILLDEIVASQNHLESHLSHLRQSWRTVSVEVTKSITLNSSPCDELKHIETMRKEIGLLIDHFDRRHENISEPIIKVLCRVLASSDEIIHGLYTVPLTETTTDISEIDFTAEVSLLRSEIDIHKRMMQELMIIQEKIDLLRSCINSYELHIKSSILKREASESEKLRMQLERVMKEKKELMDKIDASRLRIAKMEKNMDDLRSDNKTLRGELRDISSKNSELERFKEQAEKALETIQHLEEEKKKLQERTKQTDFESRLSDIHNEYGEKLEKIKQKMKVAYGEQIVKLKMAQEAAMNEKVASIQAKMEHQCKKYSEDIAKYKAHISGMSSQFWNVGEKLLAAKQEKETALQLYEEFRRKHQLAMSDSNLSNQLASGLNQIKPSHNEAEYNHNQDNVSASSNTIRVIKRLTSSGRRHSVKSIQVMGNAFSAEDEEGEVFDNVYLADLKVGKFRGMDTVPDFDRMSELRMRNSLCRPHLKSSYAVETQFQPLALNEEDIKSGPPNEDTFNDSLSQSLLPNQKMKKKDRTQTSYKRPGPPTPSKNGGRLSLQGNELKSPTSRILRERNNERRTTFTPKRLKDFFGTTLSRRQEENAPVTPKGRRLSNIFRKTRTIDRS